ncbi:MAG: FAD-binding oxidoreductase [Chloroflexota bacterium]|nr:FAD-binding oxidoreductase [Chloroflexota bacterium]
MIEKDTLYNSLAVIVGKDFVSNHQEELYIYSRDPGAQRPRKVDYVVMPKTAEEVQQIVLLANEEKVPIIPMGGGFTLSALTVPVRGGIVLDMKRMDRIIEINEKSKYAIVEAGVSQGMLKSYLERNHPRLQHSMPEAPPTVTIVGNALIFGHGHLTLMHGVNSSMINGMEVVLPTGEICKIGSCSISPYWFSRGPLPDLAGLFIGWFGTTGIVTRISLQLFPKPKLRDVLVFQTDDPDSLPDVVFEVFQTEMAENFFIIAQDKPDWMCGHIYIVILVTGNSESEFDFKKKKLAGMFDERVKFLEETPSTFKRRFLDVPPFAATAADFAKGGGFEYVGAILPIEKIPEAWRRGWEIARRYSVVFSLGHQALDCGHSIMFGLNYSFNRADEEDAERVRNAIDESDKMILELGGVLWKAELPGQKLMMKKIEPNTRELMNRVRKMLDPNGIMNPGNWSD